MSEVNGGHFGGQTWKVVRKVTKNWWLVTFDCDFLKGDVLKNLVLAPYP